MKFRRFLSAAVLLTVCGLMSSPLSAVAATWTGTAGDGLWATGTNWDTGTVPTTSDTVGISTTSTIDLGAATGNALGISIGGGATLTNGSLYFAGNMQISSGTINTALSNSAAGRLWTDGGTVYLGGENNITYSDHYATIVGLSATSNIILTNANALNAATERTDVYNGSIDFNGQSSVRSNQIRLRSGASSALINNSTTAASASTATEIQVTTGSTIGGSGDLTLSGVVANSPNLANENADQALTKVGAGKLTLSGANTYSGGTIINGGLLQFDNASAVPASGTITINNGGALVSAGAYSTVNEWLGTSKIAAASAGAVAINADSSEGISFTGYDNLSLGTTGNYAYSGAITAGANGYRLGGGTGTLTVSSVLADQNSTATNTTITGNTVLTGTNTFSGVLTVAQGTLSVSSWGVNGSASVIGSGSSNVVLGGTTTTGTIKYTGGPVWATDNARGITLAAGGGTIDIATTTSGRNEGFVHLYGSTINGDGGLTVQTENGNRFIIVGSASYKGTTTVAANSELQCNYTVAGVDGTPFGAGSNGLGSSVYLNTGSILNFFNGASGSTNTVAIGSLNGYGTIHGEGAGTQIFKVGGDNSYCNYYGSIQNGNSGSVVALTKVGSGALFLGGTNTYTGATTVDSGYFVTLNQTHAQAMAGPGVTGGVISSATRLIVNANGKVDLDNTAQTVAGLSGSGLVYSNGGDNIKGLTVNMASGVEETFSGILGYAQTDTSMRMSFTKTGAGTQILSGVNTYTGDTTISGGTLSITNKFLCDTASVYLTTGGLFNLNFTGSDTIAALYIDGGKMDTGTWGATGSGAQHINDTFFSGTGSLYIVPEPSSIALLAAGMIGLIAYAWRKRK